MKPSLVISGGGMRLCYAAGFTAGLYENGITANKFGEIYGTSGGAGIAAYYVTEQVSAIENCFKVYMPKKIIRWYGTNLGLFKKIFTELEPLNVQKLKQAKTEVNMVLTDVNRQVPAALCLNKADDPVKVLLAGLSWRKGLKINQTTYLDGGFTNQVPFDFIVENKADKVLILMGDHPGFRMSLTAKALSLFFPHSPKIMKLFYNLPERQNRIYEVLEKQNDFAICRPKEDTEVGMMGRNPKKVAEVFDLGKKDAKVFAEKHKDWFN